MSRPKFGTAAKSETVAVSVTSREKRLLTERYGTPTRALLAFITSVVEQAEEKKS